MRTEETEIITDQEKHKIRRALAKQDMKAAIPIDMYKDKCPCCDTRIYPDSKYCHWCGQRIYRRRDW